MESILLVIHVVVGVAIVGLIMIQQGKGADMGASFGAGSSQTVFGAAGTGNFFSRATAILVTGFFATSIILAWLSKERVDEIGVDIPVLEEVRPNTPPIDEVPLSAPAASDSAAATSDSAPAADAAADPVPAVEPVPAADAAVTTEEIPVE